MKQYLSSLIESYTLLSTMTMILKNHYSEEVEQYFGFNVDTLNNICKTIIEKKMIENKTITIGEDQYIFSIKNVVKYLKSIGKCETITSLHIYSLKESNLLLDDLCNLESLYIYSSKNLTLKDVKNLNNLKKLKFQFCEIKSFDEIAMIENLETLDIFRTELPCIKTIKKMTNLKNLTLCSCNITSLTKNIKFLENLEHLDLSGNGKLRIVTTYPNSKLKKILCKDTPYVSLNKFFPNYKGNR